MSNFTEEQLKAKTIGLKLDMYGIKNDIYYWVDQTETVKLPGLSIHVKDLEDICRQARAWLCDKALFKAHGDRYLKLKEIQRNGRGD